MCRLVIFAGGSMGDDDQVDYLFKLADTEPSVFAGICELIRNTNPVYTKIIKRRLDRFVNDEMSVLLPDEKRKLPNQFDDICKYFGGPPTLQQITRQVIVQSVIASGCRHGLRCYSMLGLPGNIVDFVTSLRS